jgi:hypothetical protein
MIAVFALSIPLALVGCGGGETLEGTYDLESVTSDGDTVTAQDLRDLGMEPSEFLTITFSGNDFTMIAMGESLDGSYKLSNGTISMTADGDGPFGALKGTVSGDTITIELDGDVIVFKKA